MIDETSVAIYDIATEALPVRSPNPTFGEVLSDLDSHLPAGHPYWDSDKITASHESTHGVNSRLRNAQGPESVPLSVVYTTADRPVAISHAMVNAFYVLDNNVVIIDEPTHTLTDVARRIPRELRGDIYDLYLIRQARDWDDRPLYLFDEWSAYTNGSAARYDLKIKSRGETVQYMWEFVVYCLCVAWSSKTPEDPQFKKFLRWHTERCTWITADNEKIGNTQKLRDYIGKIQAQAENGEFGEWLNEYMGKRWVDVLLLGKMGIL